jgi:hypothetical protein
MGFFLLVTLILGVAFFGFFLRKTNSKQLMLVFCVISGGTVAYFVATFLIYGAIIRGAFFFFLFSLLPLITCLFLILQQRFLERRGSKGLILALGIEFAVFLGICIALLFLIAIAIQGADGPAGFGAALLVGMLLYFFVAIFILNIITAFILYIVDRKKKKQI